MIDRRLNNIVPKDLLFVLLYTALMTIGLSILLGLIDYFIIKFLGTQIGSLLFWVLAIMTGTMVRKQYDNPHLVYSIIAGVGMLLAAVIIEVVPFILFAVGSREFAALIFDFDIYLTNFLYLYNPINWITNFSFSYLITLLMIFVGTYLGVKRTY